MIEEAIIFESAAYYVQARLWIEQIEEACSHSKIVREGAINQIQISIVLKEGHSSLEPEVFNEWTILSVYLGIRLDIDNTALACRVSREPRIADKGVWILTFTIDYSSAAETIILTEVAQVNFEHCILCDMHHTTIHGCIVIKGGVGKSDPLEHRQLLSVGGCHF